MLSINAVLFKSNASKMHKFCSLFLWLFDESSLKSSCEISQLSLSPSLSPRNIPSAPPYYFFPTTPYRHWYYLVNFFLWPHRDLNVWSIALCPALHLLDHEGFDGNFTIFVVVTCLVPDLLMHGEFCITVNI